MASTSTLSTAGRIDQASEPAELNSSLLGSLLGRTDPAHRIGVVDLGRARPTTIAVFSRVRCRLYIEDAIETLAAPATSDEDDEALFARRLESALGPPKAQGVDLVLCWELLDYLTRPRLAAFASHLAPWLERGAYLHAFIAARANIPARPAGFELLELDRVRYRPVGDALCPAPRYHQLDLGRLMPQFAIERSVLLRNGLQEYLLRRH